MQLFMSVNLNQVCAVYDCYGRKSNIITVLWHGKLNPWWAVIWQTTPTIKLHDSIKKNQIAWL